MSTFFDLPVRLHQERSVHAIWLGAVAAGAAYMQNNAVNTVKSAGWTTRTAWSKINKLPSRQ